MDSMQRIRTAAETVEKAIGRAEIAVILGSGLGDFGNDLTDAKEISYADIPGFPLSTVQGHAGKLIAGTLNGKRVMMKGVNTQDTHPLTGRTIDAETMWKDLVLMKQANVILPQ